MLQWIVSLKKILAKRRMLSDLSCTFLSTLCLLSGKSRKLLLCDFPFNLQSSNDWCLEEGTTSLGVQHYLSGKSGRDIRKNINFTCCYPHSGHISMQTT